jgi:glycine dehydrogenase subunit 1
VEVEVLPFDLETGTANMDLLKQKVDENVAAVYFENPSFFGTVEAKGQEIADLVHDAGGLLVVFVEPNSLGVLAPPSRYGADIVCGDLQSLGLHMYYGGARAGFIATPDEERFVMEYPSRLFGIAPTSHKEWGFGDVAWERTSFAKRENAKEFVGTAAALWAITAGVYLALMGPQGMEDLGKGILQRTRYARKLLSEIPGVKPVFPQTPAYREFVLNFDDTGMDVEEINQRLLEEKIFGCIDLSKRFPSLGFSGLFCVTEIHSAGDIERLAKALAKVIS